MRMSKRRANVAVKYIFFSRASDWYIKNEPNPDGEIPYGYIIQMLKAKLKRL